MTSFVLQQPLWGHAIRMELTALDDGLHVLLTGGQRSHVGAVALAKDGRVIAAAGYPGHKEQQLAEQWAAALSAAAETPATVACGIHYDDATPAQIGEILQVCGSLLARTLQTLQTQKSGDNDEI